MSFKDIYLGQKNITAGRLLINRRSCPTVSVEKFFKCHVIKLEILARVQALKVPISSFFLFFYQKEHIFRRSFLKKIFDLKKTGIFYEFFKAIKIAAMLAHYSILTGDVM